MWCSAMQISMSSPPLTKSITKYRCVSDENAICSRTRKGDLTFSRIFRSAIVCSSVSGFCRLSL